MIKAITDDAKCLVSHTGCVQDFAKKTLSVHPAGKECPAPFRAGEGDKEED